MEILIHHNCIYDDGIPRINITLERLNMGYKMCIIIDIHIIHTTSTHGRRIIIRSIIIIF